MIVCSLTPISAKKIKVITDEELAFVLYKGELSRYKLKESEEISEETWQQICEVLTLRARRYAMNLLIKTDRTRHELDQKLRKAGYPEPIAEAAITYVESFGYINDENYAKKYIETYRDRYGMRELARKLQQKGIARTTLDLVKEECETCDEEEILTELIGKRLRSKPIRSQKDIANLAAWLMRRGFGGDSMWQAIHRCTRDMIVDSDTEMYDE